MKEQMKKLATMFVIMMMMVTLLPCGCTKVNAKKVNSITVEVGKTKKIKIKNKGEKKITWRSSDKSVATVSKNGKIKGKKAGKCIVTAKVGKKKLKYKVKVKSKKKISNDLYTAEDYYMWCDKESDYPKLKKKCKKIVEEVGADDGTEASRAWKLAKYLCKHMEYKTGHDSIYDALYKGVGTCQSYTDTYWLLLITAGVNCSAEISEINNHTWNIVRIDGEWYNCDITWMDAGDVIDTSWFLKSDKAFGDYHTPDGWQQGNPQFKSTSTRFDKTKW